MNKEEVKETTIGCTVLIHRDGAPMAFAIVKDIKDDVKKDWIVVTFMQTALGVPSESVDSNKEIKVIAMTDDFSWILRAAYLNGGEYTMDGHAMQIELIYNPFEGISQLVKQPEETKVPEKTESKGSNLVTVDFANRAKK